MATNKYRHKVQYYETDQMGVVHHSNYIRWFEEARTDFMEQMGYGYDVLEREGIISPVLEVQTKYIRMVKFGDVVTIKTEVKEYNGIKMTIGYRVVDNKSGMTMCTGETKHCFLSSKGQPVSLKKEALEFHDMFCDSLEMHQQADKYEKDTED